MPLARIAWVRMSFNSSSRRSSVFLRPPTRLSMVRMMLLMGLFSSWATPETRVPREAIFLV